MTRGTHAVSQTKATLPVEEQYPIALRRQPQDLTRPRGDALAKHAEEELFPDAQRDLSVRAGGLDHDDLGGNAACLVDGELLRPDALDRHAPGHRRARRQRQDDPVIGQEPAACLLL